MLKNIIIAGLVILLIVGGIFYFSKPSQVKLAGAGPVGLTTFDSSVNANAQLQEGGAYSPTSTSTQTAVTLDASNLATNSLVILTPGASAASFTATLPSTTTLAALTPAWIPDIGDSVTIYVYNSSSATTTTIAAGSGDSLLSASSTAVIQAGKMASLEFIRNTATTLLVGMQVMN